MTSSINPSVRLAKHVSEARFEHIPHAAVDAAKRSTLDTLGAILAGTSAQGIPTIVQMAEQWGGRAEATVFGSGQRLPAPLAAWCNGSMARALEVDDCVDFLPVHPSASSVPALLALAELKGGLSGRDFLTALAVGQDVIIRMALTVPLNAMQSGRNNMFKVFGPAAAIARGLDLDAHKTLNALGISFSHAVGDGQCALDGALSLRLQQGIVAQGALISGLLANDGFTGAQNFLTGRFGYLTAFEPNPRLEYLDNLGDKYWGTQISVKPYATCRATHAAIDLALEWRDQARDKCAQFTEMTFEVSPEVYNLVGHPEKTRIKPTSSAAAQFSLPYAAAAALVRGQVSVREIGPDAYTDETILRLAKNIMVKSKDNLRNGTAIGRTIINVFGPGGGYARECVAPLGSPDNPLDLAGSAMKFKALAESGIRPPRHENIEEVIGLVSRLETLDDVSTLITCLS